MTKSPAPRTDTVLVTDDNKDVVDALAALLNDSGYKVIATYSAREALDSLDLDSTVGVVISDVRMPELDGFDFLRVVKHRFPAIKVILVTGHEITDEDVVPSGATILKKPLEFEQLLRLLPRAATSIPVCPQRETDAGPPVLVNDNKMPIPTEPIGSIPTTRSPHRGPGARKFRGPRARTAVRGRRARHHRALRSDRLAGDHRRRAAQVPQLLDLPGARTCATRRAMAFASRSRRATRAACRG